MSLSSMMIEILICFCIGFGLGWTVSRGDEDESNNYLSVKKFAEFYGISEDKAVMLIDMGRVINNKGLRNE